MERIIKLIAADTEDFKMVEVFENYIALTPNYIRFKVDAIASIKDETLLTWGETPLYREAVFKKDHVTSINFSKHEDFCEIEITSYSNKVIVELNPRKEDAIRTFEIIKNWYNNE